VSARLVEIARLRTATFAAADAVRVTARALGCDVEVRGAGAQGWLVIVERLEDGRALGEYLELVARGRAAA
jgi:hypothetical protein